MKREKESKLDERDDAIKKAELRAVSFWIPEYTPEAKESDVPPVSSLPSLSPVVSIPVK